MSRSPRREEGGAAQTPGPAAYQPSTKATALRVANYTMGRRRSIAIGPHAAGGDVPGPGTYDADQKNLAKQALRRPVSAWARSKSARFAEPEQGSTGWY
jgi:hypothetical protein